MPTVTPDTFEERVDLLRAKLEEQDLAGLILFGLSNIRYLTGFTGSSGVVVVTPDEVLLLSDFRYRIQSGLEAPSARFVEMEDQLPQVLPGLLAGMSEAIGVESGHLMVEQWQRLEPALEGIEHRLVGGLVEKLRQVKSPAEVRKLRAAGELLAATFGRLTQMEVVGRPEREVALELEMWARQHGSEAIPFDYIVAAGPRAAMPHAVSSAAVIPRNTLLVVDIGTTVDGYASDMTRTFATGELSGEQRQMYEVVEQAQAQARLAARAGASCAHVDEVARKVIRAAQMEDLFKHGLGHGVGLEVHEDPRLSQKSTAVLEESMVVTIEPGVYKEGVGGVRIEDTVLVLEEGIEVLTEFPRDLQIV